MGILKRLVDTEYKELKRFRKIADEIEALDIEYRNYKKQGDDLRALKNQKSGEIGALMRDGKKEDVKRIEKWINNYPRKIFKFKTSEEYYEEEIRIA